MSEYDRDNPPKNILEAAQLAYKLANNSARTIPHSSIPLIVHQTWMDTKVDTWPDEMAAGVEKWLSYATMDGSQSMAYFWWLDDGCKQLIDQTAPAIADMVDALPQMVEKSDIFRIVVTNSIGGVYQDVDTLPLRSPATWLDKTDILPWTDPVTQATYEAKTPIHLLLGIEGDNPVDTDTYWRIGYGYPVQLTQWALAAAPQHPILNRLLSNFGTRISELSTPYGGNVTAAGESGAFDGEDPLILTGPEAITVASIEQLKLDYGLRFEALTGLEDGGRSKAVGDTIIFPITGFAPGRGKYNNMGSKAITHKDARVWHQAQGSWRKFDVTVELGKLCRTVFGGCKEWSKVPGGE